MPPVGIAFALCKGMSLEMIKQKVSRYGVAILMVLTALFVQACAQRGDEESCNFIMNSYNERVSWSGSGPITLYLHSSFPQSYVPTLERAMQAWAEAAGKPNLFTIGGYVSGSSVPREDGDSVIYYLSNWGSRASNKQAITDTYWRGNNIVESDVAINAENYSYSTGDFVSSSQVDLESLLIHELGHVLGLVHDDTSFGSVMNHRLKKQELRREISTDDRKNLSCEY